MLSVTSATVHHSICPSTPTNATPERKDRPSWSCDFSSLSNNHRSRVRASSRKNLSLCLLTPTELNVEVNAHPVDDEAKTPNSKKAQLNSASTPKLRRHSVALLNKNKDVSQRRCTNQLYKEASSTAHNAVSEEKHDEQLGKPDEREAIENILERTSGEDEVMSSTIGKSFSGTSLSARTGGKRKRQLASKIPIAMKVLKPSDNNVEYYGSEAKVDLTTQDETKEIDDLISLETTEEQTESITQAQESYSQDKWDTQQHENWQNSSQDNWEKWDYGNASSSEQALEYTSHYMTGFPNPPGENRCWLNATLQTLFALPLVNHLGRLDLNRCSMITKTFVAMQIFWKSGPAEKQKTYQTVTRFKAQLEALDESYSSERQQDVSEFLMILLNHIKNDCEKLLKNPSDETENVPDNSQNSEKIMRSPSTTPTKRPPLTQILPFKRQSSANDTSDHQVDESSRNKHPCEQPSRRPSDEILKNPIDEFFLLPMIEHYVCQNCGKHRQRNVDNLMLYVDLPGNETDAVHLADAIRKSLEPEKRSLTCSKCKCNEHSVYTTFRECPNVLIVQINRYGMTSDGSVVKMNSTVYIPETLSISTRETQNELGQIQQFVPICSIAHVGGAMDCGHYTSYVKHGDQWFHYNDMSVTPMTSAEALSGVQTTAYLVFFVNVNLLTRSLGFTEDMSEEEIAR